MAIKDVYQAIVEFEDDAIAGIIKKELANGTDVHQLLNEGLIAAMDDVGKRFSEGELFVPEMLMAAQTMKNGLEILKPELGDGSANAGTIVIGTVKGDLHDIGKNLVGMMLEGAGFEVIDLGVDVEPQAFMETAKEKKANIVCCSALLTTTMPSMEETVAALKEAGMTDVKVMIGGAPVTQAYADKIAAHGYSEDAPGAVELARNLMKIIRK